MPLQWLPPVQAKCILTRFFCWQGGILVCPLLLLCFRFEGISLRSTPLPPEVGACTEHSFLSLAETQTVRAPLGQKDFRPFISPPFCWLLEIYHATPSVARSFFSQVCRLSLPTHMQSCSPSLPPHCFVFFFAPHFNLDWMNFPPSSTVVNASLFPTMIFRHPSPPYSLLFDSLLCYSLPVKFLGKSLFCRLGLFVFLFFLFVYTSVPPPLAHMYIPHCFLLSFYCCVNFLLRHWDTLVLVTLLFLFFFFFTPLR